MISGTWPVPDSGYGLAVAASLREYLAFFAKVHFIGPAEMTFSQRARQSDGNVAWIGVPMKRRARWLRFAKSLCRPLPAITMRFAPSAAKVRSEVSRIAAAAAGEGRGVVVIYEDVPCAYYMDIVRQDRPDVPQAVRSHNIVVKGFEGLDRLGGTLRRWAWRVELAKIRRFEAAVCGGADKFWAITRDDADEYAKRLGLRADGVLGISVDADQYASVPTGDAYTVVHVGSADLRKGMGLVEFTKHAWPAVRAELGEARLVLAGRGTAGFTDSRSGVEGLGFVADEREVLGKGVVFVNPQRIGAGIKLKSIVAMLAGKTLVATATNVEGIPGEDGKHFCIAETPEETAGVIAELLRDTDKAGRIARAGRELASALYSRAELHRNARPLLEELVRGTKT